MLVLALALAKKLAALCVIDAAQLGGSCLEESVA